MDKREIICQNFKHVKNVMYQACIRYHREPSDVQLLAASKRTDAEGIQMAYQEGHRIFGENRAQSLRDKYDVLKDICPDIEWHFIGHLQKNKVKYIVGRAHTLQSLDSLELAQTLCEKIQELRNITKEIPKLRVMVQVKMGDEESKTGISEDQVLDFCTKIHNEFPELQLCGLMMIPPLYGEAATWFQQLRQIALKGKAQGLPLDELSMGMSGDLEEAISQGSTMIRVGTALFEGTS